MSTVTDHGHKHHEHEGEDLAVAARRSLEAAGEQWTEMRESIFAALAEIEKPASAYDIADSVSRKRGKRVAPNSVYRILDFLASERLVHRIKTTNKFIACSHISCNHEHKAWQFLICQNCDKVEEVDLEKSILNKITDAIQEVGFQVAGRQFELEGVCSDCSVSIGR